MTAAARRLAPVLAPVLAVGALLAGCVSLLPNAKPAQLYRFADDRPAGTRPAGAPLRAVMVEGVEFPREATSDGILTVAGDKTAYVAGSRWVAPARVLFQQALQRTFESRTQATRLLGVGETQPGALELRVQVQRFEADYGAGGAAPTVRVAATARVARSDGSSVGERTFQAEAPAAENTVSGLVHAFDAATDQVLDQIGAYVDSQAGDAGAAARPGGAGSD